MIRVLIADDHPVVRKGLRNVFKATSDIVVAGEASDGYEVLEKVSGGHYDVLLLDISMPGIDGLELLKELRRSSPGLPVLFLSIYPEELHGVRA
ncbi:MAG TPA: response regulator transcription factor, partial [Thermodesulfovibrionales bacterium]|nr:response regulator transcription factor [Thermodesulfovibrionales bacterium]